MEVVLAGGREGGALGLAIAEAGEAEIEVLGEEVFGLRTVDTFGGIEGKGFRADDGHIGENVRIDMSK